MSRRGKPPSLAESLRAFSPELMSELFDQALTPLVRAADEEMFPWEAVRHRARAAHADPLKVWAAVKLQRVSGRQLIPLRDTKGRTFSYRLTSSCQRRLHLIDKNLAGSLGTDVPDRDRYVLTNIRDEAIASSQLEGAAVTRVIARELLRSGRPPRNHGERMIVNNFRAIQFIRSKIREPLTIDMIFEFHHLLANQTMEEGDIGRFRRVDEDVAVVNDISGDVVHQPPDARELPARLQAMCDFANAADSDKQLFLHPVVRAIAIHFWLAYDHPFKDGNGRMARALFYWSMLRQGYWLAEFLSISPIILQQGLRYYRAFLDTEQDENDLTYFIHYHLELIERAKTAIQEQLAAKQQELTELTSVSKLQGLNDRQRAIMTRALRQPETVFTYKSHARSHGITLMTARNDLLDLERHGWLVGHRAGREFQFVPAADLHDQFHKPSK